ncbi:MAG: hypothetical protein ACXWV5_02495 [Flavitalea sp.]
MKKLILFQISLLFTGFCFSQAFNAKLKFGGKDGIDILSCKIEINPDSDGPQSFTASNGSKYILDIVDGKITNHKILNSSGKVIKLSPVNSKALPKDKTCKSCILAKMPNRKIIELCDYVDCEDLKTLSKDLK